MSTTTETEQAVAELRDMAPDAYVPLALACRAMGWNDRTGRAHVREGTFPFFTRAKPGRGGNGIKYETVAGLVLRYVDQGRDALAQAS